MHGAHTWVSRISFICIMAVWAIGPVRHWWKVPGIHSKACAVLWVCAFIALTIGYMADIHLVVLSGYACLVFSVLLIMLEIKKVQHEAGR